jgi:transposase, IS6 family
MYRRVKPLTTLFVVAARPCRHRIGDRCFVEEAYVTISNRGRDLCRQPVGEVIDVLLSPGPLSPPPAASSSKRWRMKTQGR